jgi:hypothetical protein
MRSRFASEMALIFQFISPRRFSMFRAGALFLWFMLSSIRSTLIALRRRMPSASALKRQVASQVSR